MGKVNVAIAGVGCCASSLVQLVHSYDYSKENNGIMFDEIGGYRPSDIRFKLGFDITKEKIGYDLSDAIFAYPNVAVRHIDVPILDAPVVGGVCNDGSLGILSEKLNVHPETKEITQNDIVQELNNHDIDVLVCYLPSGSKKDLEIYAEAALEAKVAFINAIPDVIAKNESYQEKFKKAGVPLLGDDMRSHMGATTIHTALIELLKSRGIKIDNTYQLNFGGNMDFLNLSDSNRNVSKQISKKNALFSAGIDATNVSAGPNGYVQYLEDQKVCYLRIEGKSILDSSINIELRLDVEDSPNSAGVIITALRIAKTAMDHKIEQDKINKAMACLFKSPFIGMDESTALKEIKKFVKDSDYGFEN